MRSGSAGTVRSSKPRPPSAAGGLTPEQDADRRAVMAEPIYPVPEGAAADQMPTFMGWHRYDWSVAPRELVEFFDMQDAYDGWAAEKQAIEDQMDELRREHNAEVDAIVAEHGQEVCERAKCGAGTLRLVREYRKDPTLAKFKTGRRRSRKR